MEIFPVMELVLDELHAQIPGANADKDAAINKQLAMLSRRYADLTVKHDEPIDYSDAATRFAYVYKYVTCHSNLVYTRIGGLGALRKLFDADAVRVACIG